MERLKLPFRLLSPALLPLLVIALVGLSGCEAIEAQPDPVVVVEEEAGTEAETGTGEAVTEGEAITGTEDLEEPEAGVATDTDAEAGAAETETTTETGAAQTRAGIANIAEGTLLRSYALTDWNFVSQDGAISGEIDDVYFDMNTGRIPFVTIEYGGLLGIGDTEIAVPLSAFTWDSEEGLVLNFTEQQLETFPDQGDDWPDVSGAGWNDELLTLWSDLGIAPGFPLEEVQGPVVEVSDLRGFAIVDLGVGGGSILDMLVDLPEGRVKYVLVGFGTGAGAGVDAPFVLPIEIFNLEATDTGLGNQLVFDADVTVEMLRAAPRLDRQLYGEGDVIAAELDEQIESYWQEYGY